MKRQIDISRIGLAFEHYLNRKDMRAIEKFSYRDFEVYIGEGGPYHEPNPEFPNGWYESVYQLVFRDPTTTKHVLLFMPLVFNIDHDLNMTSEARRYARVEAAKAAAKTHVDECHKRWQRKPLGSTLVTLH